MPSKKKRAIPKLLRHVPPQHFENSLPRIRRAETSDVIVSNTPPPTETPLALTQTSTDFSVADESYRDEKMNLRSSGATFASGDYHNRPLPAMSASSTAANSQSTASMLPDSLYDISAGVVNVTTGVVETQAYTNDVYAELEWRGYQNALQPVTTANAPLIPTTPWAPQIGISGHGISAAGTQEMDEAYGVQKMSESYAGQELDEGYYLDTLTASDASLMTATNNGELYSGLGDTGESYTTQETYEGHYFDMSTVDASLATVTANGGLYLGSGDAGPSYDNYNAGRHHDVPSDETAGAQFWGGLYSYNDI